MNGIWSLTTSSLHGNVQQPEGPTQVFIVNGELRGNLGCGPFTGKLQADLGRVQLTATTPVPSIGGCTELHAALKGVNRYVISRDTQRLVLLSPDTQLHFKRIGYVTPAKK